MTSSHQSAVLTQGCKGFSLTACSENASIASNGGKTSGFPLFEPLQAKKTTVLLIGWLMIRRFQAPLA